MLLCMMTFTYAHNYNQKGMDVSSTLFGPIFVYTEKSYESYYYRKLENFHVEIIHVVNIHVDLFSWVYSTHENILT